MMCALEVDLRRNEEILSEAEWAVLTNQRLVAALNRKDRTEITDEAELSDVVSFKKSNGGQESRLKQGVQFLVAGVAIFILQFALANIIDFNEARIVLDIKQKIEDDRITMEEAMADPYLRERVQSNLFQRSSWNLRGLSFLEIGLFLAGSAGILVGFYLIIGSLMRIKPFTVVVFTVVGARDIPVHFPGQDNPDADHMTNLFTRTKRGV
jgi:hypothetical protein